MSNDFQIRRVPAQKPKGLPSSAPLSETTLLYQQKVAALIECARDYAHDPSAAHHDQLLQVARAFAENG